MAAFNAWLATLQEFDAVKIIGGKYKGEKALFRRLTKHKVCVTIQDKVTVTKHIMLMKTSVAAPDVEEDPDIASEEDLVDFGFNEAAVEVKAEAAAVLAPMVVSQMKPSPEAAAAAKRREKAGMHHYDHAGTLVGTYNDDGDFVRNVSYGHYDCYGQPKVLNLNGNDVRPVTPLFYPFIQ